MQSEAIFWLVYHTCDAACSIILTPYLLVLCFAASTIAENGRKTCLKLKVFVRPSSKCLHATRGFVTELVEVHSWDLKIKTVYVYFSGYITSSLDDHCPTYFSFITKTALPAKEMFCFFCLFFVFCLKHEDDDRWSHQVKSRSLHTSSECCHGLCCLGCLIAGLRGGLQMSLTYLAFTSNDFSFSLFSVIDSCVKTIGVHDRVFDVNERVDNTLEPRG